MLISTTQGKVISISIEQYFGMTDQQYDELVNSNLGSEYQNPFSVIEGSEVYAEDVPEEPLDSE